MMLDYRTGNKRIAKNTLVVYVQMILRMLLGLYTSRLALEALGVSDFGLNSVVGGVVLLFTFISDSLQGTTIRFINVEQGKKNGNLNRIFNICNVLHILMALFIFLLLEIGGVYYIHHFLNIDTGKTDDAMFVFQISTLVCCLGIINVPFYSLFNAAEKFLFTATVAISVKVVQLGLLIWLQTYDGNRLKAFALIETLTMLTSFIVYHYYCYKHWQEVVKWRFYKEWHLYKRVLSYSNYTVLSTFANLFRGQGGLLLINHFFGTTVNGAFAVAQTINRNISPFSENFLRAAAPQITQSYSSRNFNRVYFLTSRISKYSLLSLIMAFFPLWSELDFILQVWLVKVPEGALVFCKMILLLAFVMFTDGAISHVINASGQVSKFRITYSLITISCIPIGYFLLNNGFPAYSLLIVFIIADIIWRFIQLYMTHVIIHFPVIRFCYDTYYPILKVSVLVIICIIILSNFQFDTPFLHLGHLLLIFLLTSLFSYYIGLNKTERVEVSLRLINIIKGNQQPKC